MNNITFAVLLIYVIANVYLQSAISTIIRSIFLTCLSWVRAASHSQNIWKTHSYMYKYLTWNKMIQSTYSVSQHTQICFSINYIYLFPSFPLMVLIKVVNLSVFICWNKQTNPLYISFTVHFHISFKISIKSIFIWQCL